MSLSKVKFELPLGHEASEQTNRSILKLATLYYQA